MENILKQSEEEMKKAVSDLQGRLNSVRAGRANTAILDKILVDYYGTLTPIQQMANVSISENRILIITPWDKSTIGEIEKAILKHDIGISPNNDGSVLRLAFPQPTEERRKELNRDVRAYGEDAKVVVRNARRAGNDALKVFKDSGDVSEDIVMRNEELVQDLTDKYVKEIDKVVQSKEKEILAI